VITTSNSFYHFSAGNVAALSRVETAPVRSQPCSRLEMKKAPAGEKSVFLKEV
jgi:hypothetical protein